MTAPPPSDKESLADLYMEGRLFANAAAIYASLCAARPGDAALSLKLARACYHNGDFDEALAAIESAGVPGPELAALREAILRDRREATRASGALAEAQPGEPGAPEAWLRAGRARMAIGRFEAAAAAFARVLESSPRHFEACRALGACQLRLGRPREAAAALRVACATEEAVAETWLSLARALLADAAQTGAVPAAPLEREAEAALARALELDPQFLDARFERAALLACRNDDPSWATLAADMRAVLDLPPDRADPEARARACWQLAQVAARTAPAGPAAIQRLEEALGWRPDFAPALRDLAGARAERGQWRDAARLLWRLIEREPADPQPYAELAARCYAGLDADALAAELQERLRGPQGRGAQAAARMARLAVAFADAGRQELLRAASQRGHRLKNRAAVASNRLLRWARRRSELAPDARAELDAILGEQDAILADWLEALRELQPQPRHFAPLDAREPLKRALADALLACPGRFDVRRDLATAPLMVNGDEAALYDVFHNLLKNALQAMGQGGELTVRCRRERATAIVEIEDNGHGAADAGPRDLERLFAEGYTTRDGGSGFGLPIARYNVRLHGGALSLQPVAGGAPRGLLARVSLPLRQEAD